jgi:uncharacterized membrane protein
MLTLPSAIRFLAAIATFSGPLLTGSLRAQVTFTELTGMVVPYDVSDDGAVVAGLSNRSSTGVRWTASTGSVLLSTTRQITPAAISADGSVIVGIEFTPAARSEPVRWTPDGITRLNTINNSGTSTLYGVSGDGSITVGSSESGQATRWDGQTPTRLPGINGENSYSSARAISTDGSTIVGLVSTDAISVGAVQWTGSNARDLAVGGFSSVASAVSADGSFIAGYIVPTANSSHVTGFIWNDADGATDFSLRGWNVMPNAVSADGSLVVGLLLGTGPNEGFFWTKDSGLRDFTSVLNLDYGLKAQLKDWTDLYPWQMSSDGRYLVGEGFHDGVNAAWLLDRGLAPPPIGEGPSQPFSPVPESSTYGAVGSLLLLGLAGWRQRQKQKRQVEVALI